MQPSARAMFVFLSFAQVLGHAPMALSRELADLVNAEIATVDVVSGGEESRLPSAATSALTVQLDAFGKRFVVDLVPSDLLEPHTRSWVVYEDEVVEIPTVNYAYRGVVRGENGSWARLTLFRNALAGRIVTKEDTYLIEPEITFGASDNERGIVVYRASENPVAIEYGDCTGEEGEGTKTARHWPTAAMVSNRWNPAELPALASEQLKRLDVGVIADYEFLKRTHYLNVTNAMADMQASLNNVDGIYRQDLTVTLRATNLVVFDNEQSSGSTFGTCMRHCRQSLPGGGGGLAYLTSKLCLNNNDCTHADDNCYFPPGQGGTCSVPQGKLCLGNLDCPGGICKFGGSDTQSIALCKGGPDDGRICQGTGCSAWGNCCAAPGVCSNQSTRILSKIAGYRQNLSSQINMTNSGVAYLFSSCPIYNGLSALQGRAGGTGVACDVLGAGSTIAIGSNSTWNYFMAATDTMVALTAHELGHVLGAPHDDNVGVCGPLTLNPSPYIMQPGTSAQTTQQFSQCSKNSIGAFVTPSGGSSPSCFVGIKCGDVTRNGGNPTATDALAAQKLVAAGDYDDLADVMPNGSPNLVVTSADANRIQGIAVGTYPVPTVCGD